MSRKKGKDMLRTNLLSMDKSLDIDELLCYKCGNKDRIDNYQNGFAEAKLNKAEIKRIQNVVPVVVKYFCKSEIYAGWHSSVGLGSGKYRVDTAPLKSFESDVECDYRVIVTGHNDDSRIYLFRNNSGIIKFFEDALRIKEQKRNI